MSLTLHFVTVCWEIGSLGMCVPRSVLPAPREVESLWVSDGPRSPQVLRIRAWDPGLPVGTAGWPQMRGPVLFLRGYVFPYFTFRKNIIQP